MEKKLKKVKKVEKVEKEAKKEVKEVKIDLKSVEAKLDSKLDEKLKGFESLLKKVDEKEIKTVKAPKLVESKAFFKALIKKDYKTLNETSDAEGGYTVPEEFVGKISELIKEKNGILRTDPQRITQSTDTLKIPKDDGTALTVYFPGENASIGTTKPGFGLITLSPVKMATIVKITNELRADSGVNLEAFIADKVARRFAQSEDDELFNGAAVSPNIATGILNDTNVTTVNMATGEDSFADLDEDDLVSMTTQLGSNQEAGAKWYMHKTILGLVRKLKDDEGQPLYQRLTEETRGTILGWPVTTSDQMPAYATDDAASTAFMVFGNMFEGVIFADRKAMTVEVSTDATVGAVSAFENDLLYWRFIQRIDFDVAQPEALVVLKTGATS